MGILIPDKPDIIVIPVEDPRDPRNTRLTAKIHVPSASIQIPDYNDTTYVCPHYIYMQRPPNYIRKENFEKMIRDCEPFQVKIFPDSNELMLFIQESHNAVTHVGFHSEEYAQRMRIMS